MKSDYLKSKLNSSDSKGNDKNVKNFRKNY